MKKQPGDRKGSPGCCVEKSRRIKIFAGLFEKAVVSKGKAFGRVPQDAKYLRK
ncbi:MAG: hypothetical protein ACLSS9_14260 [Acutalibacteraceae bacterium]